MAKPFGITEDKIELPQILHNIKLKVLSEINCHNIGKITYFDADSQTCTVELMQVKQFNNNYYTPAPITDVPLIVYGAGGGHITLPNPVGTYCLLLFMDRNIDSFLETGQQYVPETSRMHDFTDCVAITTFKTLVNPIGDYDINAVTISYQNTTFKVKDSITANAKNDITLKTVTKIVLDAPEVETTGNLKVATGYTGVVPCGSATLQITNGIITGVT